MPDYLIATFSALSAAKCRAYGRHDTAEVAAIEARIAALCAQHQLPEAPKVCACVWRGQPEAPELLVFEHPQAGYQIVKGSLEGDEDPGLAALRELEEEAGLQLQNPGLAIGSLHRLHPGRPFERGPLEHQHWQLFLIPAPPDLPEQWQHAATGSIEEEGLLFRCFWQPLNGDYRHFEPVFQQVLQRCSDQLWPADSPFRTGAD